MLRLLQFLLGKLIQGYRRQKMENFTSKEDIA